jgi:NTP pyrophosphatase (non-canonical NTP hydrolase)
MVDNDLSPLLNMATVYIGRDRQCRKALEECGELIQAICKYWANQTDENKSNLAMEMAHVRIMICQLERTYNVYRETDYYFEDSKKRLVKILEKRIKDVRGDET